VEKKNDDYRDFNWWSFSLFSLRSYQSRKILKEE
jgi:hypothetical protein